jgi:CxxC motif-containing protein (DUF1111 family)
MGLAGCESYEGVVTYLLPDFFQLPAGVFEQPAVTPSAHARARFLAGHQEFVAACGACHLGDARTAPPLVQGSVAETAILRLIPPDPHYGARLDLRAASGASQVAISYKILAGRLPDGEAYELRVTHSELSNPAAAPLAEGTAISLRAAPPVIGFGLIAAIEESELLAAADPEDRDGDGISGRASRLAGSDEIGRFGWKAEAADFNHDAMTDSDPSGVLAFYLERLGAPPRLAPGDPREMRGGAVFASAGCAACHAPRAVARLTDTKPETEFYPYSDFLLHDMGRGLADRGTGPAALEWRTAPLWGLAHHGPDGTAYLHDGRARNLMEAILWHGGEARAARKKVRALPRDDRAALIAFLKSL